VKPLGTPFDGTGIQTSAWFDTGAPLPAVGSAVPLDELHALAARGVYTWRLRLRSSFPYPWQSHWMSLPYNSVTEWDLRTEGPFCFGSNLNALAMLKAVKDGTGGADFNWSTDPASPPEYHLNSVVAKASIDPVTSKRPPVGVATPECTATGTPACKDPDAIGGATELYYQVYSACTPSGLDEGPF